MPSPQFDTDLVAAAIISDNQPAASTHEHHGSCKNCGAALAGKYCHECGQVSHVHRSLFHIAEELLHGLFHFDTKMWRTIPALFFYPGKLTREYIDGKRVRYVAPLPLYLFLIFLMFFVFSMTAQFSGGDEKSSDSPKAAATELTKDKQATNETPASSVAATTASDSDTNTDEQTAEPAEKHKDVATAAIPKIVADLESDSEAYKNTPHWMQEKLNHAAANPELVFYKMKGSASKFALLLLPLALPVMWLLFPFSRRHVMFDHCVFILYSLSFAACAMMILSLMSLANFAGVGFTLICAAMPLHMYRQLRGTYLLTSFQAAWRTMALLFAAFISLALYATALLVFSL